MSFDPAQFDKTPNQEELTKLKKDDLLALAAFYNLEDCKKSMRKGEIRNILVQYLVEEEKFPEEAMNLITQTDEIQLRQMEIQREIELEKLRIQQQQEEVKFREQQRIEELK